MRIRGTIAVLLALTVFAALTPARAVWVGPAHCVGMRPDNGAPATGVADLNAEIRVFAIQFKQEIRYVESYESFALKMDCLIWEHVLPLVDGADEDLRADFPVIVAFNEDIGLATIATGSRGTAARQLAESGPKDPQNIPGALSAFASLGVAYAPSVAWYAAREPETGPQRLILAAATDNFARGFMKTFSDLARRYNLYVVASNNQAEFRETADPAAVAALRDPDLLDEYTAGDRTTVYEAVDNDEIPETVGVGRAGIDVTNQAWMWAPSDPDPTHPVQHRYNALNGAPLSATDPRRNIIQMNKKTPLTSIETSILDLSDDRDMRASNTGPFTLPVAADPGRKIKIGYGISLPSFKFGNDFGEQFTGDPCATPDTWMRCLDARGVNLFLQPEANPGRWADYIDTSWTPAAYQSLSWLDSAWRAVADPTLTNFRYAVTPHLVGNLVDLTFDGQSAIFERCLPRVGGDTCDGNTPQTFVGARGFLPCAPGVYLRCDDPALEPYAGALREAVVMAPWVMDDPGTSDLRADREAMAVRSRAMEAGTGSEHENAYLETAIWADLDFD